MGKKIGEVQKLGKSGQKWEKFKIIGNKLVLYVFYPKKKYIKDYKMMVIWNKEDTISYYQLKKMGKKSMGIDIVGRT